MSAPLPEGFATGEMLELTIPRLGQIADEIRWSAEGFAGARFLDEVDCQL